MPTYNPDTGKTTEDIIISDDKKEQMPLHDTFHGETRLHETPIDNTNNGDPTPWAHYMP